MQGGDCACNFRSRVMEWHSVEQLCSSNLSCSLGGHTPFQP